MGLKLSNQEGVTENVEEIAEANTATSTNLVSAVETPFSSSVTESKVVWIKRARIMPTLPIDQGAEEETRKYKLNIGPSFTKTGQLLGRVVLTNEEERRLMPSIVGVDPQSQDWNKALNDYWSTLSVVIPFEGKRLEIGGQEKDGVFYPIQPADYVLYKYCLSYSQVATTYDEIGSSPKIRFYLWEETQEKSLKLKSKARADEAILLRMSLEKNIEQMNSVIVLSGNTLPRSIEDRQLLLVELSKDTERFLALGKDKKLLEKAFVERLIKIGALGRPLHSTLVTYDGAVIGKNLEEAAVWLGLPTNSDVYLSLKAKLEAAEQ